MISSSSGAKSKKLHVSFEVPGGGLAPKTLSFPLVYSSL